MATSMLAVIACTITAYCRATGNEAASENTNRTPSLSEQQTRTTSPNVKGKALVVYFSVPETDGVDTSSGASRLVANGKTMGNTQYIASVISEATGGDLFEIKTVHTYPGSHKALIDAAKVEIDNNARPKLATHIKNLKDYDVIFIGYPNWWYDMPMVIYSFFDAYDFKGKTIIPFVTHGGSRFSQSVQTIKELEKEARVIEGPSVSARNVPSAESSVIAWLEKQGFKK